MEKRFTVDLLDKSSLQEIYNHDYADEYMINFQAINFEEDNLEQLFYMRGYNDEQVAEILASVLEVILIELERIVGQDAYNNAYCYDFGVVSWPDGLKILLTLSVSMKFGDSGNYPVILGKYAKNISTVCEFVNLLDKYYMEASEKVLILKQHIHSM